MWEDVAHLGSTIPYAGGAELNTTMQNTKGACSMHVFISFFSCLLMTIDVT